ncbi:AMP-binding protein [Vibrio sp. PP-XX7]
MSFDASLANIFMALFCGARLVCVDQPTIEQPQRFLRFIREQRISVATLPPVYLKALNQPEFPGLQTLITAGEAADAQDALHYAQSLNVFNAYGPTEVSVCATIESVSSLSINEESVVSIGQPITNTDLFIVVDNACIAPIGVPGEIWIAGDGLAKAYVGDEIGTSQAFVPVPESLQSYAQRSTMYKTGDLACWDHRGRLIYIGRNDHQVKVNAFRVDTREIEGYLQAHQEIAAAHVASYSINDTHKLAAWVMPQRHPELWLLWPNSMSMMMFYTGQWMMKRGTSSIRRHLKSIRRIRWLLKSARL